MTKKISFYGIFAAISIMMGYIELILPNPFPLPGIKLGLANVITIIVLYLWNWKTALSISFIRIILSVFLFSGIYGIIYSISGGIMSIIAMNWSKKAEIFSVIGVSIIGSISHNVAQVICASIIIQNINMLSLSIPLIGTSILTGIVIGFMAKTAIERLKFIIN